MNTIIYPYTTHHQALPGNCNINYIDEGKGERTLLFIHGLANYALVWKHNIDYLKQYYRCIAIDLPGNGLSDRNDHKFSMQFFADTIHEFIHALGLKNVTLVGHSMGGQIALTTVIKYPTCAKTIILCAPAGFEHFTALDRTMAYTSLQMFDFFSSEEQNLRSAIENSFHRATSQGEGIIKELVAIMRTYKGNYYKKMVDACIKAMLEEPVYDKLNTIKQPTLVMFGSHDALIPNKLMHHHLTVEKIVTEGTKKMPQAMFKLISNAGHFVQWEKADDVNKFIILFLEEMSRGQN